MNNSWNQVLSSILNSNEYKILISKINDEYKSKTIYPEYKNIFKAFDLCSFNDLKVVIIGQDPYHGEGEAEGLSFSVPNNVKIPPSLRNIFKELEQDLNIKNTSTSLEKWSKQGVLLLNSILTVEKDRPASHQKLGWQEITDKIISKVSDSKENIVFILWGNYAISKSELIDKSKHYIITSSHPSPFSARKSFFGSSPFSRTNKYLKSKNLQEIDFKL